MTSTTKQDIEAAFEDAIADTRFCSLGKILAAHEYGDLLREKIEDNARYSSRVVSRVLRSIGAGAISPDQVTKHRKHDCLCYQEVRK